MSFWSPLDERKKYIHQKFSELSEALMYQKISLEY